MCQYFRIFIKALKQADTNVSYNNTPEKMYLLSWVLRKIECSWMKEKLTPNLFLPYARNRNDMKHACAMLTKTCIYIYFSIHTSCRHIMLVCTYMHGTFVCVGAAYVNTGNSILFSYSSCDYTHRAYLSQLVVLFQTKKIYSRRFRSFHAWNWNTWDLK
jgi:hypothetical protein